MPKLILIVDDDPVQRRLLEANVARMGYRSASCTDGEAALAYLAAPEGGRPPAVIILDLSMPGIGGVEALNEMRRIGLDIPVVVQTAKGSIDTAVEAMRAGAFDFIVKPASPERLRRAVDEALRLASAKGRRWRGSKEGEAARRLESLSPAMHRTVQEARRAASSLIPILLEGETGVGKEWLARAILAAGPRAAGPFVAVNCGALPSSLAESILFGHAKGAFTDASEKKIGKFVEADGGTLFLDEVGELPPDIQAKLLRVLQDGKVDPVGGQGGIPTNVRIISATNRDLEADVAAGRFRSDLFFRLNVLSIRVPSLRERREEILPLAERFLIEFAAIDRPGMKFHLAPDAVELLTGFDWPGNIRQLENAVHRAVVLAEGETLLGADFPQIASQASHAALPPPAPALMLEAARTFAAPPGDAAPILALPALGTDGEIRKAEEVEAELIRLAMQRYGGRLTEVARRLGIGRSTLYRKLQSYGLAGE